MQGMSITVHCSCGKNLEAPERMAGKKARCPSCKQALSIPFPDDDEQDAVAPRKAAGSRAARYGYDTGGDEAPRRQRDVDLNDDGGPNAKKRAAAGSNKMMLILGIGSVLAVLALLVLAGGGFAVYWFLIRDGDSSTASVSGSNSSTSSLESGDAGLGTHQKYLPDNTGAVMSYRMDRIRSTAFYKDLTTGMASGRILRVLSENFGVAEDDIERLTMAGNNREPFVIFTTKKPSTWNEIARKRQFKDQAVGSYTMYTVNVKMALVVPESGICLQGTPEIVEAVLRRARNPVLNEKLKKAMDLVDFSKYFAMVANPSALPGPDYWRQAEAVFEEVDISSGFTETATILFKDAKTAEDMQPSIEADAKKQHERPDTGEFSVSIAGSKVIVKETMTADEAKNYKAKVMKRMVPGG
jgi:hypothetical protein